jgi:glucose-6-phosphate isomerase
MQLPDEAISYQYQGLLATPNEDWTAAAELRTKHLVSSGRLKGLAQQLMQIKGQVAAERELQEPPPELLPLEPGFIDLPQKMLDQHRRKADASLLSQIMREANRLRAEVDRVVILGAGGSCYGARALFDALRSTYHNELFPKDRPEIPRIYFEGHNADNDAMQDLLDVLQTTCVDPELREERWGVIVVSPSGDALETAAAYRTFRREAAEFYGSRSERIRSLIIPVTGTTSKLRDLCLADGYDEAEIVAVPDKIGDRFSVFTAAGLLPAAAMGLDVRAILLGAAAMTRRFLEEPFERNPVLQYAGLNYLMCEEFGKSMRIMLLWSKKLEALGQWYDHILSESLGKQGRGPTPLTVVAPRDLYARGQQFQDGTRDKVINNVIVKATKAPPIMIGMSDRNEDDLNVLSRKGLPDIVGAAHRGLSQSFSDVGRPTADVIVPSLTEHTLGQLMQMLMLATVIEGRLMGINPYGQPGAESYKRNMRTLLKQQSSPQI